MTKMNRLTTSLLGAALVVLPLAAPAQAYEEPSSPAIAVSIGATFGTDGQVTYGADMMPTTGSSLDSLAVSVATGDHAAVANSTAVVSGPVTGSTANAGATNNSNTDLESLVGIDDRAIGYESEVNVTESNEIYTGCQPYGPVYCGPILP
ncbi:hypothetical protein Rumeso_00698 [Rubellimicrobium mesophilum DSM 19309]|uniref:Uncharacterized protein n=1 Tax=Rubellimicrobium mesophilum DSM 19309 TaxID=442562 RepID=A0A017HTS5_9RHOB|nr:hypothetical protein [Rubellimicrobium mesophilum]EYD77740.1 hypothetical protein Rumeso_00698 [Rubellimicrobium mesophilum DSM 19309]